MMGSLIEHYESDPDPLNLEPELAALRALFEDYVARFDEHKSALLAWHQESGDERPPRILEIADAKMLIAEIGRLAERIQKIRSQNAISAPELYRIFSEIKQVIDLHVDDREVRERLADRLGSIRVALNP